MNKSIKQLKRTAIPTNSFILSQPSWIVISISTSYQYVYTSVPVYTSASALLQLSPIWNRKPSINRTRNIYDTNSRYYAFPPTSKPANFFHSHTPFNWKQKACILLLMPQNEKIKRSSSPIFHCIRQFGEAGRRKKWSWRRSGCLCVCVWGKQVLSISIKRGKWLSLNTAVACWTQEQGRIPST